MAANWKVAWITGASTGIGHQLALDLAGQGVKVAASARSEDRLSELAKAAPGIAAFPLDVTAREAVAESVARIEADTGPIDLAILNAAIGKTTGVRSFNVDTIRAALETNYMGVIHGLDALLPRMIERGGGQIAIVASLAGYRGFPDTAAYSPTKAALINLAEGLRVDAERFGVRISVVNPGFVDTPMTRGNTVPMPFMLTPEAASRRIIAGLKKGKFEIAFPRRMVWLTTLARMLPNALFFALLRRQVAGGQTN